MHETLNPDAVETETPGRRMGRPPIAPGQVKRSYGRGLIVSLRMPDDLFDALSYAAARRQVSVSEAQRMAARLFIARDRARWGT